VQNEEEERREERGERREDRGESRENALLHASDTNKPTVQMGGACTGWD